MGDSALGDGRFREQEAYGLLTWCAPHWDTHRDDLSRWPELAVMQDHNLAPQDALQVCLIHPDKSALPETFIRAHIERLPGRVRVLYGDLIPSLSADDGRPLFSLVQRGVLFAAHHALGQQSKPFLNAALGRYFRRERIQAVLAEYGPTGVAVMDACQSARIPLVVYFHGFDAFDRRTLGRAGRFYPELFEKAAAVIAVSRGMEHQLQKLGAPPSKIHYNPSGVDTTLFHGGDPGNAPPSFLSVGRFVDKKAPHLTVLAFNIVRESVPEARMTMIGGGPLLEACRQLARSLGVSESIQFPGTLQHTDVAHFLRGMRALVQHSVCTSYGDSEGTPNAVLEAGATGLPVVATKHAGIQDAVVDGETGILVDEGDIEAMAKGMTRLAEDAALASRLGRAARDHVSSAFSMEKSINNLWHIIVEATRSDKEL